MRTIHSELLAVYSFFAIFCISDVLEEPVVHLPDVSKSDLTHQVHQFRDPDRVIGGTERMRAAF